jgi:hypothetical protein
MQPAAVACEDQQKVQAQEPVMRQLKILVTVLALGGAQAPMAQADVRQGAGVQVVAANLAWPGEGREGGIGGPAIPGPTDPNGPVR